MYGPLQAAGKFVKPLGVEVLTVSANERFLLASSKLIFGVCKEIPIADLTCCCSPVQHSDKFVHFTNNEHSQGNIPFFSTCGAVGIFDDVRKLSHENLISQLMNSNDYNVNLR